MDFIQKHKNNILIGIVVVLIVGAVVGVITNYVIMPTTKSSPKSPIDCIVNYSNWSSCSYSGVRSATGTVTRPSANGGAACPPLNITQECAAPVDCVVSDWNWGNCGYDGVKTGTRTIITPSANGGLECPTDLTDTEYCAAPVDCVVSDWNWGNCMRNSTQNGSRQITTTPANGGAPCPTDLTSSRYCDTPPVDCVVSEWSNFSNCDKSGFQTSTATITTPSANGGNPCPTETVKSRQCGPTYIGCYKDTDNPRSLGDTRDRKTVAECNQIAKDANSAYFGMQYWQSDAQNGRPGTRAQCWYQGGSTLLSATRHGEISPSSCPTGTDGLILGAGNSNAIYKTF